MADVTVTNTTTQLSGKTLVTLEADQTVTGIKTFQSNLLFTDATYDIGASGASRPRDLFLSRNAVIGGTLALTGVGTFTVQSIHNAGIDISGASAGQIKFPATQNASTNVNTLDDYEEGTFVLTDGSGAGLTITSNGTATYVKVGKLVFVTFYITYPATADGTAASLTGLPFTSAGLFAGLSLALQTRSAETDVSVDSSAVTVSFKSNAGGALTNANMSTVAIRASGCYIAST